jgi:hypothetical protein
MSRITQAIRCIRQYSTAKENISSKKLVYTSPNVGLVRLVKKFSLTTLGVKYGSLLTISLCTNNDRHFQ